MERADSHIEHKRIGLLSNEQILEVLAKRMGNQIASQALDKARIMMETTIQLKPDLAPGLVVAANLLELYQEALDPQGRLCSLPAGAVEKIVQEGLDMLTATAPVVRTRYESGHRIPGAQPVKATPTWGSKSGNAAKSIREKYSPGASFEARELLSLVPDRQTLGNALQALRRKGFIEKTGPSSYRMCS